MLTLLTVVGLSLLIIGVAVYVLASLDMFFTFVPEGEIKFIMKGEGLAEDGVLCNVQGWKYDKGSRKIEQGNNEESRKGFKWWLHSWTGIYGPFLFPFKSVHEYKFTWDQWEQVAGSADLKIVRRSESVDSMYFEFTYPVKVEGVELKGNMTISVVGNVTVRAVDPYRAIFQLKGSWYLPLLAAIDGGISDYCREKDFDEFQKAPKSGPDSDITKAVLGINKDSVLPVLVDTLAGRGVITTAGVEVVNYDFASFEFSGEAKDVREATQALSIATAKGLATVATAKAKAESITLEGNAEASVIAKQVNAGGYAVVVSRNMARAISEFGGSVLGLGSTQMPNITLDSNSTGRRRNPSKESDSGKKGSTK